MDEKIEETESGMNRGEMDRLKNTLDRSVILLCLVLASLPFLYLVDLAVGYSVDVPHSDDWRIVPLLEKSYRGTLDIKDFFIADSHPHRSVFPRLMMLISARLTGWNLKYQYLINILLGAGIFLVVTAQLKLTVKDLIRSNACRLIPVIAVLIFSVSQWQNWFWGWQICIFLNVLAVLTSIYLLSHPNSSRIRFAAAIGLAVVATYSFANGLLFWPIGLFIISTFPGGGNRKRLRAGLWSLIGLITIYAYLSYPAPLPGGGFRWNGNLFFIFRYLGTPLIRFGFGDNIEWEAALYAGMLSSVIMIILVSVLLRTCRVRLNALAPWISFILYAIGSALLTSLGRAPGEAVSSRYVTIGSLYWVAGVVLLFLLAHHLDRVTQSRFRAGAVKYAAGVMIVIIAGMAAYQSLENARVFRFRTRELRDARDRLNTLSYGDSSILGSSCRSLPIRRLIILKRHQLSVFRER